MTAFLKPYASAVLLLSLCACQQPRPMPDTMANQYPFDLPPSLALSYEILPGVQMVITLLTLGIMLVEKDKNESWKKPALTDR